MKLTREQLKPGLIIQHVTGNYTVMLLRLLEKNRYCERWQILLLGDSYAQVHELDMTGERRLEQHLAVAE